MVNRSVQRRGFTFIEVLVVLGITGLIVGLAIPFYQSFQVDSRLDDAAHEAVQTLRRAQALAMGSESFSAFGVHFESQRIILFRGDVYVAGDAYNQVNEVPLPLSLTAADIVFEPVVGTANTGAVTISTSTGRSHTITINTLGVADLQ